MKTHPAKRKEGVVALSIRDSSTAKRSSWRQILAGTLVAMLAFWLAFPGAALAEKEDEWPRGHYPLPEEGNVIGDTYTVTVEDYEATLIDIARRHNLGYREIVSANPDTSIWIPGEGTEVKIPAHFILPDVERTGIVINLAELRLYYYPEVGNEETPRVETYPIGIGREGFDTPLGTTKTTMNIKNPAWYPPESVQREARERGEKAPSVVPPGPENPLGDHAIILGFDGYLIHGTNRPDGIGMRASRGCIRMLPEDIESIFDRVPAGTQVNIINQPIKIGWDNDQPLVQVFPLLEETEHSMATVVDTITRLNQRKVEGMTFDYQQLRSLLETPNGRMVALNPQPEPDSKKEDIFEGVYEESTLRGT
jgi:L,D-transpeptidase ErfK/SrfK